MLKPLFYTILLFFASVSCKKQAETTTPAGQTTYDFVGIDKVLQDNLQTVYKGSVYCNVTKDGNMLYSKGMGGYDENSLALIASCSKTFSAVVILALVDDGLLKLDDKIGKYLPVFNQYSKGDATIRQCFSHTAGFQDDDTYIGDRTITLEEATNLIAKNIPQTYIPGSTFYYGGVSMHIAGRIAEVVSGKSWTQLFKEKVIDKLGLTNTSFNSTTNPRIAGGILSTPADIRKLSTMLLNKGKFNGKQVLSENSWNEFWKDQTNGAKIVYTPYIASTYNNPYNVKTVNYGFGCWLDVQNPATKYVEQISGDGAYGTMFWIDRCRNATSMCFTSSTFLEARLPNWQVADLARKQLGSGCN